MAYAIDEFRALVSALPSPASQDDKRLWYLASLIAELAYYELPEFELENDQGRRAKVIPCDAFQLLYERDRPHLVQTVLREADLGRTFVIIDRGVIAVGLHIGDRIFIGFRGTVFLYDWRINLKAPLTKLGEGFFITHDRLHPLGRGLYHRGFAEEAARMGELLQDQIAATARPKEIVLTGHSLGGAVAAVCEPLLWGWADNCKTVTFGAPRFCDASALYSRANLPLTIKRPGDMVPLVPPRSKGYADCPREFDTLGRPGQSALRDHYTSFLKWRWTLFAGMRARDHSMERYRQELGALVGAGLADRPLTSAGKIR